MDAKEINKLADMYYSGLSESIMALRLGITKSGVSYKLREAGITTRWPKKEYCHCGRKTFKDRIR